MSSLSKSNLLKAVGALLLTVGSLALLVPVLTVSAKRDLPGAQQDGIVAPMKPIQPVSVATVNFKKLAEAEANNMAMGIKSPRIWTESTFGFGTRTVTLSKKPSMELAPEHFCGVTSPCFHPSSYPENRLQPRTSQYDCPF